MTAPRMYFLSQPLVRAQVLDASVPLPTEFRLFLKGENASVHGSVLFDDRAAELVMAQAERHGVDFMVDLEHRALFGSGENDSDARGWFRPELRDGELWAVDVTWTDDGEARLRGRRQRYTSPAFWCDEYDDESQMPRVTSLINVAICAMPATYQIAPLVASANAGGRQLDGLRPSAYARGTMPEAPEVKPEESAPEPAAPEAATEPEASADAGLNAAERAELEVLRAERDQRQAAERRSLVTELVSLGAETPATAWSNGSPVARLAAEPLDDLRARVAALRSVPRVSAGHTPPPAGESDGLSDVDRANAEKITDPKMRAQFIALRRERHNQSR